MHREWKHDVSETWLQARQPCLTASDIKSLITDYKKLKAEKIGLLQAQQFAKVYGTKQQQTVDTSSFGAMARGHILEPYAVAESEPLLHMRFHWWDDRIICHGSLGFSPDALDIEQPPGTRIVVDGDMLKCKDGTVSGPTKLLEIKCYEAGNHYQRKAARAADIPLDERWQVACGMAVCPTIEQGIICFYAPQCSDIFHVKYDREDLKDEIDIIHEINSMWDDFCELIENSTRSIGTRFTEDEIYNRYLLDEMGR